MASMENTIYVNMGRVLLLYCLFGILGVICEDDTGEKWQKEQIKFIGLPVAYGALLLAFCVIAGLFSLGTFIFFTCKKWVSRKLGIHPEIVEERGEAAPKWTENLVRDPLIASYGFGTTSDGITVTGSCILVRHRRGNKESDGARWSNGFTSGKHVFEIVWPRTQRGAYAQIGLGTKNAPLNYQRATSLVGMTDESWGLDIVRRRVIHKGDVRMICPKQAAIFVPEKFLMYVDMDSGKLGFGSEEVFWGIVASDLNLPGVYPLYIMVGMSAADSHVEVIYRGSEATTDDPVAKQGPSHTPAPPSYESLDESDRKAKLGTKRSTPDSPPPPYKDLHP